MTESNDQDRSASTERIVIKKYANRRLYNTEASAYVTLDDLAQMVREDRDFVVRDVKTGSDLTHSVLTQIIVEQESKADGPTLLPIPFLRQLICYYDDAIAKMVPGYLQTSMAALAKEQERYRAQMSSWGPNAFEIYQEQARKNLAMFENALAIWAPYGSVEQNSAQQKRENRAKQRQTDARSDNGNREEGSHDECMAKAADKSARKQSTQTDRRQDKISEIDELRAQLAAMQEKIEKISRSE